MFMNWNFIRIVTLSKHRMTGFSDRINYLCNIFGVDRVAMFLGQDAIDVSKWANSETLDKAPTRISYTYFLHKNPEFNEEWLEEGTGDVFKNGSEEYNIMAIREREYKDKIQALTQ